MSTNNPVDPAAVVGDAPLGDEPDGDDEVDPVGQSQEARQRMDDHVDPSGADPAAIPDPMPEDLAAEGRPPADTPEADQMGGEAPTG